MPKQVESFTNDIKKLHITDRGYESQYLSIFILIIHWHIMLYSPAAHNTNTNLDFWQVYDIPKKCAHGIVVDVAWLAAMRVDWLC